ncbi:MAG: thiamine phosphate synthase [Desulforhopalus sp.]
MSKPRKKSSVLPSGLYTITAEKFSVGRTNIEVVEQLIKGGVRIIQYREKRPYKSYKNILDECRRIRAMTRAAGVTFIINDYVDIALLVGADGVHVGQDDLPVGEVKKLLGRDKIVGLSTHSPEQAQEAIQAGADYIGVGPIFATKTKDDVCDPVGLDYLDWVVKNVSLPFVAIGGIKLHNIDQLVQRGAKTICLVSEIVGAPDIGYRLQELHSALQ